MRKKVWGVFLAVVVSIGLLGCNNTKTTTEKNTENKITLNVWHQWSNDTNELKRKYDEAVLEYEKEHSNITIHTKTLDTEAYKTKISSEFAGEAKDIDVFFYWGAGKAKKLVQADKLLALDDYITEDIRAKLLQGSTSAFEYDGKTYSLPSFSWYLTLFCNRDLFEKAGAKIPSTYDELTDAVGKLLKLDGVTPLASGARDGWNAALIYQALALREVGAESINKMLNGEEKFENEGYREAARKVVELYEMGAFGHNPLEQGNDDANLEFGSGHAAMRLMGSWYANNLYVDRNIEIQKEDIVAVKIPMIGGKGEETDYCGGFVESFWVNGYTEYQEEAAKFAIYINEKMGIAAFESGSGFSGWKTESDDSGVNPLFLEIRAFLEEGRTNVFAWDTSLNSGPAEIHNEQVQTLFAPNADVEKFIEKHKEIVQSGQ